MSDDEIPDELPDLPPPPVYEEHEIPPWGGQPYGRPWRPDMIPALDPAEFRDAVLACIPREWPKGFPSDWSTPVVDHFKDRLFRRVGLSDWKWTPVYQRFTALMKLLENGDLGRGWPSQADLLRSEEEFMLHPAVFHTAAQLTLTPSGDFDPVEFRHEAVRVAKRMGLALPPGLLEG